MRYLIRFSYDGTNFYGYQKQPSKRTVQGELEKALGTISKEKVTISASGRTDALVHALNQYAHFDFNLNMNPENLQRALNSLLPNDIYIKEIRIVDSNFHARFCVKEKEYIYKINLGEYNPLMRNYIYQYNHPLNIIKMQEAIKYLEGKHSFKSFTKSTDQISNYEREIYITKITNDNNILTIMFRGNGFLRYMVRNMVGTLISVGEEKIEPKELINILALEDRTKAKKTAPPEGLYLNNVYY